MNRDEIVRMFTERQKAVEGRDAAAMAAFHAVDGTLDSPMAGGVIQGRDNIEKVFEAWFSGFPDLVSIEQDLVVEGNRVVNISHLEGHDFGGFMGLPATGKPFRVTMVFIGTVENGEISTAKTVYDFSGLLMQIGVLKVKPAG
jgi:steroid delta-isomerase-like uncharacterized protein